MKKTALVVSVMFALHAFAQDEAPPQITDALISQVAATYGGEPDDAGQLGVQPLPPNATCSKDTFVTNHGTRETVKWCIFRNESRTKNPFVLYHFHGLNGSERRWGNNYSVDVMKRWKDQGFAMPTVITISFGKLWLLTQTEGTHDRYDLVMQKIMPYLEWKIGPVLPSQRILLGESMGGFNGSEIMMKNPELFSRFAFHCPAITKLGPFDSLPAFIEYIKRTGANVFLAVFTRLVGILTFSKPDQWDTTSQLTLAEKATYIPTKLYLACGNNDEFGFDEGTEAFAQALAGKTEKLQYVHVPDGHHMDVDIPTISDFLSEDWRR